MKEVYLITREQDEPWEPTFVHHCLVVESKDLAQALIDAVNPSVAKMLKFYQRYEPRLLREYALDELSEVDDEEWKQKEAKQQRVLKAAWEKYKSPYLKTIDPTWASQERPWEEFSCYSSYKYCIKAIPTLDYTNLYGVFL
jgi:hypothetical protein